MNTHAAIEDEKRDRFGGEVEVVLAPVSSSPPSMSRSVFRTRGAMAARTAPDSTGPSGSHSRAGYRKVNGEAVEDRYGVERVCDHGLRPRGVLVSASIWRTNSNQRREERDDRTLALNYAASKSLELSRSRYGQTPEYDREVTGCSSP